MKLMIISSSQRTQSQSAKVGRYLAELSSQFTQLEHIELCTQSLPMWDGDDDSKFSAQSSWAELSAKFIAADALILITPEWGGTASPLLKNLLMMCEMSETGHKPVLIISVVNGISGAYPIAELRMNAFSNNKLVAIPDHLIIRNVEDILNSPEVNPLAPERDNRMRHRINYSLHTLFHYAEALSLLRKSLAANPFAGEHLYRYGM